MNVVMISGNITKDIRTTTTKDGVVISNGTVAVNRKYSKTKETDFINFVAIGNNGNYLAKYGKKGSFAEIIGRWQNKKWTDKSGVVHYDNELVVDDVKIVGGKQTENSTEEPMGEEEIVVKPNEIADDDLPF